MPGIGKTGKVLFLIALGAIGGGVVYFGGSFFEGVVTIHEMLAENKELRQAIGNLTTEDQIGYAKVVSQVADANGSLTTTLRFVETARDDKLKRILEKEYSIAGDVVHFDVLIVKFGDQLVSDGKKRALYLWRRIYGEETAPKDGLPIEEAGAEPQRYADLLEALPLEQRQLFWSGIWDLANNPDALKKYGIDSIYGSVVYRKLRPGLIYVFKIYPTGQVYPEVVVDM